MQSAKGDTRYTPARVVGEFVRTPRRRDVDLDHDQVGLVIQAKLFDVLVTDRDFIAIVQVGGQGGEAERREQRILDGPEEWTRGFGQRGQDHLDSHRIGRPTLAMHYQREFVVRGYWMAKQSDVSRMSKAIDFELPDHEGKAWRLADHLARGPVVLVFYRGDW